MSLTALISLTRESGSRLSIKPPSGGFLLPAGNPMQTKTLFISAGHSDADPGAVGNGYTEADIVLEFRDYLAEALRARGVEFRKDGEPGQNLPLARAWRM